MSKFCGPFFMIFVSSSGKCDGIRSVREKPYSRSVSHRRDIHLWSRRTQSGGPSRFSDRATRRNDSGCCRKRERFDCNANTCVWFHSLAGQVETHCHRKLHQASGSSTPPSIRYLSFQHMQVESVFKHLFTLRKNSRLTRSSADVLMATFISFINDAGT